MTLVRDRVEAAPIDPTPIAPAPVRAVGSSAPADAGRAPWIVAAWAGGLDADTRTAFLDTVASTPNPDTAADRFLIATCQRVELYGTGPAPEIPDLIERWPGLVVVAGDAVVDHVLRLVAGLDSAILGEDQVLHQVRSALRAARDRARLAPELGRLIESAIQVGRRARSTARSDRSIAMLALDRLGLGPAGGGSDPNPDGPRVLVVGAGTIGELVARAAIGRGLHVAVASRTLEHAETVAARLAGPGRFVSAIPLAAAGVVGREAHGIVVALTGRWEMDAATADGLPPLVDLSAPPAIEAEIRPALGGGWTGIDELLAAGLPVAGDVAFVERAERLVADAATAYARWLDSRASVVELRRIAAGAEHVRSTDVAALLRRIGDVSSRQAALIEQFSEQLVARLLHEPLSRLGSDVDGSVAAAARRVFGS